MNISSRLGCLARKEGLKIPVVYNCGGYESVSTVKDLADTVDIWMPDMKYMAEETAARYSNAPDYFERASAAISEMVEQVRKKGGTSFKDVDPGNVRIMERGVIVRHMLLPGNVAESKRVLRYLHGTDELLKLFLIYIIINKCTLDTHFLHADTEQIVGAAVDRRRGDEVVAALTDIEYCVEVCSLA